MRFDAWRLWADNRLMARGSPDARAVPSRGLAQRYETATGRASARRPFRRDHNVKLLGGVRLREGERRLGRMRSIGTSRKRISAASTQKFRYQPQALFTTKFATELVQPARPPAHAPRSAGSVRRSCKDQWRSSGWKIEAQELPSSEPRGQRRLRCTVTSSNVLRCATPTSRTTESFRISRECRARSAGGRGEFWSPTVGNADGPVVELEYPDRNLRARVP